MEKETRNIQITLPKEMWQHLEETHDDGGPSPGEMIRGWIDLGMAVFTMELLSQIKEAESKLN
jgi:hypothetical protein